MITNKGIRRAYEAGYALGLGGERPYTFCSLVRQGVNHGEDARRLIKERGQQDGYERYLYNLRQAKRELCPDVEDSPPEVVLDPGYQS